MHCLPRRLLTSTTLAIFLSLDLSFPISVLPISPNPNFLNRPISRFGILGLEFKNGAAGEQDVQPVCETLRWKAVPRDSFSGFNEHIGVQWLTQSAVAKKQEENDDAVAKLRKEASPEECDQAVEGLTTAKAKAMAKRSQESPKEVQSVLRKVWTALLGIDPVFRVVASMSREDWAKKLVHWKGEFVSTLQHYWLGSKLLWADVRISSRLLLKLAGGKSLSRRERQQLTRTTADIFRLVPFAVFIIVPLWNS